MKMFIKVFNSNSIPSKFEFMNYSRIDGLPIYQFEVNEFYGKEISQFLTNRSKLLLSLRILKINRINKKSSVDDSEILNILQFLKDNYNTITLISQIEDNLPGFEYTGINSIK